MNKAKKNLFNYSAFETFFRGQRSDIKKRLLTYLPIAYFLPLYLPEYTLDVGCGRGEWLELLAEHGIRATGIDINHKFVDECRQSGLEATEADLFDFLVQQEEGHYRLMTGFHIVEHLAPDKLPWFLDILFTLLAPGGIVILETPNPENLTVGSCNFYLDPTHVRP